MTIKVTLSTGKVLELTPAEYEELKEIVGVRVVTVPIAPLFPSYPMPWYPTPHSPYIDVTCAAGACSVDPSRP